MWRVLKKLEIELPYDPAIPLQGIHTEETRIERDTCTPMFIEAPFTIARTWKQPRCPLADEWIRKLWYIYTMEYYSAIKKNTFESVLMRWMKLGLLYRVREKAMAPHSSTLAWKIPWTEEPGRLQSMRSQRVRHDWATSLSLFIFMHWRRKWQLTPVFLPGESQGQRSLVACRLWGCTELDVTEET